MPDRVDSVLNGRTTADYSQWALTPFRQVQPILQIVAVLDNNTAVGVPPKLINLITRTPGTLIALQPSATASPLTIITLTPALTPTRVPSPSQNATTDPATAIVLTSVVLTSTALTTTPIASTTGSPTLDTLTLTASTSTATLSVTPITPSETPIAVATDTPVNTPTVTDQPTETLSATPSATVPTPVPTIDDSTVTASPTLSPTQLPTVTDWPTITLTTRPRATRTAVYTATATASNVPQATSWPTAYPSATRLPPTLLPPTASATVATVTPTATNTIAPPPTLTPTVPTATFTALPTLTLTPSDTATVPTATFTALPTVTPIPSDTATDTPTATFTALPTLTLTPSDTATDTPTATLVPSADLAVTVTANKFSAQENSTVTFIVRVLNKGPNAATTVQLINTLPNKATFVQQIASNGNYAVGSGLWDVGGLAVNASATLRLTVTIQTGTAGTPLTDSAALNASTPPDPNPTNDSGSVSVQSLAITTSSDLSVSMTASLTSVYEGSGFSYHIVVNNSGPDDATSVQITDVLPTQLLLISSSVPSYTGNLWNIGNLSAGATITLDVNVAAKAGRGGTVINNVATITRADQADPDPTDNTDSVSTTILASGEQLTMTVSDTAPHEGDTITYTLTLSNWGGASDSGVQVTDVLPIGLTLSGAATTHGSYASNLWNVGTLASGSSATLTLTVNVNSGTGNLTITNTAAITAASQPDPNTANNTASVSITVLPLNGQADVAVSISASTLTPDERTPFTYTVIVSNFGPNTATNVQVSVPPPANLSYSSVMLAQGSYNIATNIWSINTLGSGATAALVITAASNGGTAGMTIVVTAVASADQIDPVPANNIASTSITVASADLGVTMTLDNAAPHENDVVTYVITVTDHGPLPTTNVMVTDLLPGGLTYNGALLSQGSYNNVSGIWTVGSLAFNGNATLTLSAKVNVGTAGGTLKNQAAVTRFDLPDTNASNNMTTLSLVVAYVPTATPSMTATPTVTLSSTPTSTITNSATPTFTPTASATLTYTPSPTLTPSITATATDTFTFTPTATATPTNTATLTFTATASDTATNTATVTATATASDTPTATATATLTLPPTASDTATNTATATATATASDTPTATATATLTFTPTASDTATNTATATDTATASNTPTATATATFTLTPTASDTPTNTATATDTATASDTPTATATATFTLTPTASDTPTNTATATATATFTLTPTASDTPTNTATATATVTLTPTATNTATASDSPTATATATLTFTPTVTNTPTATLTPTNTPIGSADLAVVKTVSNFNPPEGTNVTYSIFLKNNGPSDATGIQVTDNLPVGVTFVSYSSTQGSYTNLSRIWDVGSVANGVTAMLQITVNVNTGTAGQTITNTVNISAAAQIDPNTSNNTFSAAFTSAPAVSNADIGVTMSGPSTVYEGYSYSYTISTTNSGPNAATGLEVTDMLPAAVTFQSASSSAGTTYTSGTGKWTIGNLSVGSTVTLTLNITVNPGTAGMILTNTANVTALTQSDPNLGNNTSSLTQTIQAAGESLFQTVTNPSPIEGTNDVFHLKLCNYGGLTDNGVQVADVLPSGFTFVSASASQGAYASGTGIWTVGSLGSGVCDTLDMTVFIKFGTGNTTITNTAVVSGSQPDPNTANNTASASINILPDPTVADLMVSKTVDNATPTEGQLFTYTIKITNNGPGAATGVKLTDLQPAGITFTTITPSQGTYTLLSGLWDVGNLTASGTAKLTIQANANGGTGGQTITNTASISAANQTDPNTANNTASVSITVASADLGVTMIASTLTPNEGDTVVYTVVVTNHGPSPTTNVQVTDLLPAGETFVSAAVSQGAYNSATGVWTVGNLALNGSATLTLSGNINSGTGGAKITNIASVSFFALPDPNPSNNSANTKLTVAVPPTNTPTYTPTIPTNTPTYMPTVPTNTPTYTPTVPTNTPTYTPTVPTNTPTYTPTVPTNTPTYTPTVPTATPTSIGSADLAVVVTAGGFNVSEGDSVSYFIFLKNNGPSTATGIRATDLLPPHIMFANYTTSQGTYTYQTGIWNLASGLASGATAMLQINVTVKGSIHGETITQADQSDPVSSNNTFSVALHVI